MEVHNIVLLREPIGGAYVLQFRRDNGLGITSSGTGGEDHGKGPLSVSEYSALLGATLNFVRRDLKRDMPDVIQTDVMLVEDTWRSLVRAVASQTSRLDGTVTPKINVVDNAAVYAIRKSDQVARTCEIVELHGYVCSDYISLNPIAFEDIAIGLSWDQLADLEDHGISDQTWFGVSIEQDRTR